MSPTIYTIGHSTRRFDEFLKILQRFHLELIVDIRAIPRSRNNPQFDLDILKENLETYGIRIHPSRGTGRPKACYESLHKCWVEEPIISRLC